MTTTIRDLFVGLGVDADDASVRRFDSALESTKRTMASVVRGAVALTAGLAGLATGAGLLASGTASASEEIRRQAQALGVTTDAYQEILFAFRQFGLEGDDVADAINTITDRALDAAGGMQSMADDFALIGIGVGELRGKRPAELFATVADAMAATDDPAKRATAAVRILGDDIGRKLLPAMMGGSEGFAAMASEARALGAVMDEATIKRNADAARRFRILGEVVGSLRMEIGSALVPVVLDAANRTFAWVRANRDMVRLGIARSVEAITRAYDGVRGAVRAADRLVTDRLGGWRNLATQVVKVLGFAGALVGVRRLVSAVRVGSVLLRALGVALAGLAGTAVLPIGIAVAGLAQLLVVADDLVAFLRGGRSVVGSFLDGFDRAGPMREAILGLLDAVRGLGAAAMEALSGLASVAAVSLGPAFAALSEALSPWLDAIVLNAILGVEKGILLVTDAIQLATLALEDFDGFLAKISERTGLGALLSGGAGVGVASAVAGPVLPLARAAVGEITGARGGGGSVTNTFAGDSLTITGSTATPQQIEEILARRDAQRRRQAYNAARGGER